ncbi:MAG: flagellar basal body-associated FliL family protein [Treponema sp.]|jgi:flagellar basal body-associated protein FliL|nr:flagellar basal body-associated FliL family protein [Treponema sp.]
MERIIEAAERSGARLFCRILAVTALVLFLLILGGTLYALFIREKPVSGASPFPAETWEDRIFTGIGRVRSVTAGSQPATVILSPVFPYSPGDRPFSEELAAKLGELRRITVDYFTPYTAEELRDRDEEILKEELRSRYNAILRLGRIESLYFNDYMIIE